MNLYCLVSTVLIATCINAYEECNGDCCSSVLVKPDEIYYGKDNFIGIDKKTECYCIEKPSFTLCFGRNLCTSMPKSLPLRKKSLKLANTHIKEFVSGDFKNLDHLVDLIIEGNYDLEKISSRTFENLNNLVNLSISYNSKLKLIEADAFLGLINLKHLFLNNNALEHLHDISVTLRPTVVPNLLKLILDSNTFLQIDVKDFSPMENSTLKELSLVLCRVEYIHPNAMAPLKKLRILQLGENSINTLILTKMFEAMVKTNKDLRALHLFNMGFKKNPPKSILDIIAKTKVSHINLSKNHFEVLTKDSFPLMLNLEILDLRENLIVKVADDAFTNLPNLKTIWISGNKLSTIPNGVQIISNLSFLDIQQNSPSGMSHLYFTLDSVDFKLMQRLRYLNMGFNGMTHLNNKSLEGLKELCVLELQNSSIFFIDRGTFVPLENLRLLNLMNNPMGHAIGDTVPDVFFPLKKLEILYMGSCGFRFISKKESPFRNLHSLRYLGLEGNQIAFIKPVDFQSLLSVRKIDLSANILHSWSERIFTFTKNLTELSVSKNKLTDISVAMFEDLVGMHFVDLDQNAILCNCLGTYRSFNKWRQSGNDLVISNKSIFSADIHCAYPEYLDNVTLADFLTKSEYGEQVCLFLRNRINYALWPLICFLALIAASVVLAFYYRWHIKYWIFLSKLYLSRTGKLRPKQEKKGRSNYDYDAFVSYSTEDRDIVIKVVSMMENHEPYFRLCVYERDFQIGTIISESVLESVARSRKTILVISDNYAKSQWCRWESQICEHHRLFFENEDGEYVDDSLLLIKIGSVSESLLTPTLKYLLKTRIYLQWEWDERKQDVFWTKLRNTLGRPITEITHM